ncbi:anti-sigma-F factor Fin family protein [Pullulanibacillus sp. KACC 23026]|uniref:anti-sigma-F factor Fin family protein n=1 Tax=Pullulanibacillus sp. KACC 23026 TaxID=3028315 RepID=UPI0023AF3629|nr:anti-sigma-F factor Fin family protein [Pullulanibacillus sp. KACC 23026]WEG12728.1 anti-sigma-F factor Fin family protein [Pullulanibacillus sp. KACC 23026]
MEVRYNCRHCGKQVGTISSDVFHTERLGLDSLNSEERTQFVTYDDAANAMNVSTICEDCQEALERNPHYHELDTWIQ